MRVVLVDPHGSGLYCQVREGKMEGTGSSITEGIGIMRPRLGTALWEAARAELGVGFPLGPRLVLAIRAGAGVPLSRPQFVIDGSTPVHRPAAVVARAAAGVELEF